MFCKNCGNQINEGAKFCKNCGAPVVAENVDTPVTFAVPPPFGGTETTCVEMPTATPPPLPPVPPSGVAPFEEAETSEGEMPPVITPPPPLVTPIGLAPQPPVITPSRSVIPEKKGGALKYVLLGVGGLIVLWVLACVGLYFFNDDFRSSFDEGYRSARGLDTWARVDISGNFLNMRSGPSMDDMALVQLPNGAELKVFFEERSGQWVKVAYNNIVGYVHGDYLLYLDKQGAAIAHSWIFGVWDKNDADGDKSSDKMTFNLDGTFIIQEKRNTVKGRYTVEGSNIILKGKIFQEDGSKNNFSERMTIVNNTLPDWWKEGSPRPGSYYATRKTYFYDEANENAIGSKYIAEGDVLLIERLQNGFGYGTFTNEAGRQTTGWLKMSDMKNNTIFGVWKIVEDVDDDCAFDLILYENGTVRLDLWESTWDGTYDFFENKIVLTGKTTSYAGADDNVHAELMKQPNEKIIFNVINNQVVGFCDYVLVRE